MLFFLFVSLLFSHPTSELNLTITPEKKVFQSQEPIMLLIKVENKGNVPLQLDSRFLPEADEAFPGELTLLVTAPKERPLPFLPLFESSELREEEIIKVLPRTSIERPLDLSNFFKLSIPGPYLVQVIYDTTTIQSSHTFWKGRLVSLPIIFEIESPREKK